MIISQELLETALNVDILSKTEGRIDLVESQSTVSTVCRRLEFFVVSLFRLQYQYLISLLCVLLPKSVCGISILHQHTRVYGHLPDHF